MLEHGPPPWRVLLVGGASGVGKTILAQALARHYGVSLLLADDVRLALQQVTTPEQQPALHYFLTTPDVWRRPADEPLAGFVGVATALAPALGKIISHHLDADGAGPLIIEGDGIAPSLLGEQSPVLPHIPAVGLMRKVRALLVDEPDDLRLIYEDSARPCASRGGISKEVPTAERTTATFSGGSRACSGTKRGEHVEKTATHYR